MAEKDEQRGKHAATCSKNTHFKSNCGVLVFMNWWWLKDFPIQKKIYFDKLKTMPVVIDKI